MVILEVLEPTVGMPPSLLTLSAKAAVLFPSAFEDFTLPQEIGHLIMKYHRDFCLKNSIPTFHCEEFYNNFKSKKIPLKKIDFSALPVTGDLVLRFLEEYKDQVEEINIAECRKLGYLSFARLNEILKSDRAGGKSLIIGDSLLDMFDEDAIALYHKIPRFDKDLKLKKLVLHKLRFGSNSRLGLGTPEVCEFMINMSLAFFLTPTMSKSLKYLDLSMCSIGRGSALVQLESIEILILFHCEMIYPEIISTICQLKTLRALDISRRVIETSEISTDAEAPRVPLHMLTLGLPKLASLDISGTNLVGRNKRTITALECRADRPLEFLGLFHTDNDAAYRSSIPALKIASEANENHLLNACEAYIERPCQLSKALNDLYNFFKTIAPRETYDDMNRALEILLTILVKYIDNEQMIIVTTAALWFIVKIQVSSKNLDNSQMRRAIITRLLDVMTRHVGCSVILINGCLTLLFMPDMLCEHFRIAKISIYMCRDRDPRTQGFGTTILNTLACQVGGEDKITIGRLKAIETMLDIIRMKVQSGTCDEMLETAWSTLWNITDETPVNCKKFLNSGGLDLFEDCMDAFSGNKEVLRNMMGSLGNVAECKDLRYYFREKRYVQRIFAIIPSHVDGIECSYNACGITAHLISDGDALWDRIYFNETCRQKVLEDMRKAISQWPINSMRNINYRSFKPILGLIELNIQAEAQYWAVFALTNLTRVNPEKYCPMLLQYSGLDKLRQLAQYPRADPDVQNLARIAVYQYERFEAEGTLTGLEHCNSVDLETVKNFRSELTCGDGASDNGEPL